MTATIDPDKTYPIVLTAPAREQDLLDVLTTGYEQGIAYWCTKASGTQRAEDLTIVRTCLHFEAQHPDGETSQMVDAQTVARGVQRILNRENGCSIRDNLYRQVLSIVKGDPDVDADAADCVIQAGVFGEIIYG